MARKMADWHFEIFHQNVMKRKAKLRPLLFNSIKSHLKKTFIQL